VQQVTAIEPDQMGIMQVVTRPQIVGYNNRIADMVMDIIVDAQPDTATLQEEQFQALSQMAANGFPIPPELIIRASSLPNKRELLEAIEAQKQQPDPAQQAEAAKGEAEVSKLSAEAQYKQAQATQLQQEMGFRAAVLGTQLPPPGMTGATPMAVA
jgi:hypothetical protein